MSVYFEIAYATASNRLCLFTGTGFSKALTEGLAPGWQELLENCCDLIEDRADIKSALFPADGKNPLSLEEAAQVIDIELSRIQLDIHQEIARQISLVKLSGDNAIVEKFFTANRMKVITTNYDKIAEQLAAGKSCNSFTPGLPIPRSEAHLEVYHVHGSIDSDANMIVTSDDYFHFINAESYFSRKLSTVLHENTVVILGYSLADTNLKAIISDYKGFTKSQAVGNNIFFVSRARVDQHIKDYYSHCYGIRVIDQTEVHTFFARVDFHLEKARQVVATATDNLRNVLFKNYQFTDDYLKIENSLFEIVSSLASLGKSVNDGDVTQMLSNIIRKKVEFTRANGAWEQYSHLAIWLVYIATLVNLDAVALKDSFLEATLHSMTRMASSRSLGYSWQAYRSWSGGWADIGAKNRNLIRDYIVPRTQDADALTVVNQA